MKGKASGRQGSLAVWPERPAGGVLVCALLLASCATHPPPKTGPGPSPATQTRTGHGPLIADTHVPPFASQNWEVFSRADAIAIALREWRLFGQPVDDDPPDTRPPPLPDQKPERMAGLWERVGEYWWEGQDPDEREAAWTGMHDENGVIFEAGHDGGFAWSAAFISYVMRIAGAGTGFPYSPNHSTYINAAVTGAAPALRAHPPEAYAPKPGDIICTGRDRAAGLRFRNLPAPPFPSHCDIVVAVKPGELTVIGGNVDDAVTAKHIPVTQDTGTLADPTGHVLDARYPWMAVLEVLYVR